jgi:hypothetical protein
MSRPLRLLVTDRANRLERLADTLAERAVELEDHARAAEAALADLRAKVEALAEGWESGARKVALEWNVPIGETFAKDLRDVLEGGR